MRMEGDTENGTGEGLRDQASSQTKSSKDECEIAELVRLFIPENGKNFSSSRHPLSSATYSAHTVSIQCLKNEAFRDALAFEDLK